MQLSAQVVSLVDLFCAGRFTMPWHQRYYDWTTEHVFELLNDLLEASTEQRPAYFLGNIMLIENVGVGSMEINDGQQRMVTLSLVAASFMHLFRQKKRDPHRAAKAQRIIYDVAEFQRTQNSHLENYAARVAPPANDKMLYYEMLHGHEFGTTGKLVKAWTIINLFVNKLKPSQAKHYFDYMCSQVEFVRLIVPGNIDANAVFETINYRGKQLDDLDLIRNQLYAYFKESAPLKERVHDSLEQFRALLQGGNTATDYARCYLQSAFGFLPREKFYKVARVHLRSLASTLSRRPNTRSRIFQLVEDMTNTRNIQLYKSISSSSPDFSIFDPFIRDSRSSRKRNIRHFLRELRAYSVAHPVVFTLLRKYLDIHDPRERKVAAVRIHKIFELFTSFVMRSVIVVSKYEPSRFEENFAELAKVIRDTHRLEDINFYNVFSDIENKDIGILNDRNFYDQLLKLEMKNRNKIKQFLYSLNTKVQSDEELLLISRMSVEHILPASELYWNSWNGFSECNPQDWVHRVGNLTILGIGDNKADELSNSSFDIKCEIYSDSAIKLTNDICAFKKWCPNSIAERQQQLAKLALKTWPYEKTRLV